jgi:peptidoglycan/LPS O-acetylase OafA/YrhL
MPDPQRAGDRILGFDGLRAIAFLMVFVSHKWEWNWWASPLGDIGVWLFFVLSGFLITRILAASRSEIESGATTFFAALGRFYARRTVRIFPIYYLILALIGAASLFVAIDCFGPAEITAYWLYATNILIGERSAWVGDFGHLWSLAVEEQFYLLFAPLLLLAPRKLSGFVCLAFVAFGVAVKVDMEQAGATRVAIDVNSFINFALLGVGGLIGLAVEGRRWSRSALPGLAQAAVLAVYAALPFLFARDAQAWLIYAKISGLLAALLLTLVFVAQSSWFVRLLHAWPLRALGRISYGAYLIHHFVHWSDLSDRLREMGLPAPDLSHTVAAFAELAITIVLASLSWRLFEEPILRWTHRARTPAPIAASTAA